MTNQLYAGNDFHNTEAAVNMDRVVEMYETTYGGMVAVLEPREIARLGRKLCGISDCCCSGLAALTDRDGHVYAITVPV